MIVCGWCHAPTSPDARCANCKHADPAAPWVQRGETAPEVTVGRAQLDEGEVRGRYNAARAGIEARGGTATVEALAEALDRSPRTVRQWRKDYGLR